MEKYSYLMFSFLAFISSFIIGAKEGIAIGKLKKTGELYYSISGGSDDNFVLSLGLISFVITGIYSFVSIIRKHKLMPLVITYLINLAFFVFILFLISLDTSLLYAAKIGDWLPLFTAALPFTPLIIISIHHLTNSSSGRKKHAA